MLLLLKCAVLTDIDLSLCMMIMQIVITYRASIFVEVSPKTGTCLLPKTYRVKYHYCRKDNEIHRFGENIKVYSSNLKNMEGYSSRIQKLYRNICTLLEELSYISARVRNKCNIFGVLCHC